MVVRCGHGENVCRDADAPRRRHGAAVKGARVPRDGREHQSDGAGVGVGVEVGTSGGVGGWKRERKGKVGGHGGWWARARMEKVGDRGEESQ